MPLSRPGPRLAALLVIGLLALLGRGAAWAAGAPEARRLAQEGAERLDAGSADEAQVFLEHAYRLVPSPEVLFQLGRVAAAQGREVAAADLWRRYQEEAGEAVPAERRAVMSTADALRGDAGEVTVTSDSGALVVVDGHVVGVLPLALPLLLPAGTHVVRLLRGARVVTAEVTLPSRRQAELRATFAPPASLVTLLPTVLLADHYLLREPALQARLQQAVATALAQERAAPIAAPREAAQRQGRPSCGALDAPCLLQLAQRLDAQLLLLLRAEQEPPPAGAGEGGALHIALTLWDVAARTPAARTVRVLPAGPEAAAALAEALRQVLRDALSRPQGALRVRSDPPGAQVWLDGHALGAAPLEVPAFVGPHWLELRLPGRALFARQVAVRDDAVSAVAVALEAQDEPAPPEPALISLHDTPPPGPAGWRRPLALTLLSLGGLAVVSGVIGFALDSSHGCTVAPCQSANSAVITAPVLTSLGGAAILGGGVLLYLEARGRRHR